MIADSQTTNSHNQRLYICLCLKSYKSYPALYTHIKIKHNMSEEYFTNSKRPNWINTKRGRPKKVIQIQNNSEYKKMQIIQEGFFQIIQRIKSFNSIKDLILQGDQQFNQQEAYKRYQQLKKKYGQPLFNNINKQNIKETQNQLNRFYFSFVKHATSQLAGKIIWTLNSLQFPLDSTQQIFIQNQQQVFELSSQSSNNIWSGVPGIGKLIYQIYRQWIK